jgi:hypothetical protein
MYSSRPDVPDNGRSWAPFQQNRSVTTANAKFCEVGKPKHYQYWAKSKIRKGTSFLSSSSFGFFSLPPILPREVSCN